MYDNNEQQEGERVVPLFDKNEQEGRERVVP